MQSLVQCIEDEDVAVEVRENPSGIAVAPGITFVRGMNKPDIAT
ncbi:hypothetical protein [Roseiflexus castenholzii]|nr:hypothetical protein [Roseiflexus castenholzii]